LVSVQHYHFKEASHFLAGKASKATILIFNNFLGRSKCISRGTSMGTAGLGLPESWGKLKINGEFEAGTPDSVI